MCTENLVDGKILGEGKLEKRKKKSLSEFIIKIFLNSMVNIIDQNKSFEMKSVLSILSLLVALKSMATGSGKVWGTKLSPKVQRKRVKSKVALLKVGKNLVWLFFENCCRRSSPTNWKASRSLRDSPSGCRLLISTEERSLKRSLKTKIELLASLR